MNSEEKRALRDTLGCLLFIIIGLILDWQFPPLAPLAFSLAILIGGYRQTWEGLQETWTHRHLNVDLLMALAAIGAAIIGNWLEGALLTFIFCLSGALEEYATGKSKREISQLIAMQPETALKIVQGQTQEVPVASLAVGDQVLVPKGANIPIDGRLSTPALVDESAVSGESVPLDKQLGDEVFGGTLNLGEALTLTVSKVSTDTLFAKIIQLVEEAQNTPSETASFIDKIENIYVKVVLLSVPLLIFGTHFGLGWDWQESFYRGMVLLVVASPCALVASATPATLSAISNGARHGLLFKGGIYLEQLSDLRAIAFDKTGTLTYGRLTVTDAYFLKEEALAKQILVSMEQTSSHPLAQAIVHRFQDEVTTIALTPKEIPGQGMEAEVAGQLWRIGKPDTSLSLAAVQLQQAGKTVICLTRDQELIAYFGLLDTPRPEASSVIAYLKAQGIHTTMLTGDNQQTALAVGTALGLDEIHGGCLPQEKTRLIQEQKAAFGTNAMIGDGINDAPALANATIGFAMGQGTAIAMDVADVVLMKDDLTKLQMSHQLSLKMKRIITQNICFSVAVILFLICSNILQLINLPFGVVAHEGSTILVILNGLRLLRSLPSETIQTSTEPLTY